MRSDPIAIVEQAVPETLATKINKHFDKANASARSTLESALACGRLLVEAKDRLGHGNWKSWCEREFKGSYRTAQIWMRIANNWDSIVSKAQSPALLTIEQAMSLLAPSEPVESPRTSTADRLSEIENAIAANVERLRPARLAVRSALHHLFQATDGDMAAVRATATQRFGFDDSLFEFFWKDGEPADAELLDAALTIAETVGDRHMVDRQVICHEFADEAFAWTLLLAQLGVSQDQIAADVGIDAAVAGRMSSPVSFTREPHEFQTVSDGPGFDVQGIAGAYSRAVVDSLRWHKANALLGAKKLAESFRYDPTFSEQRKSLLPATVANVDLDEAASALVDVWQEIDVKSLDKTVPVLGTEIQSFALTLCVQDDVRGYLFGAEACPRPFAEMWAVNVALAEQTIADVAKSEELEPAE